MRTHVAEFPRDNCAAEINIPAMVIAMARLRCCRSSFSSALAPVEASKSTARGSGNLVSQLGPRRPRTPFSRQWRKPPPIDSCEIRLRRIYGVPFLPRWVGGTIPKLCRRARTDCTSISCHPMTCLRILSGAPVADATFCAVPRF